MTRSRTDRDYRVAMANGRRGAAGRSVVYFIRLSRTARDVLLRDSTLLLLLYNTRIII